jgi:hypothetical protein
MRVAESAGPKAARVAGEGGARGANGRVWVERNGLGRGTLPCGSGGSLTARPARSAPHPDLQLIAIKPGSGALADWPVAGVPRSRALVCTVWSRTGQLVYVGMADRGETSTARGFGRFGRLASHASGRRSGDQFCVYLCARLVWPRSSLRSRRWRLGRLSPESSIRTSSGAATSTSSCAAIPPPKIRPVFSSTAERKARRPAPEGHAHRGRRLARQALRRRLPGDGGPICHRGALALAT